MPVVSISLTTGFGCGTGAFCYYLSELTEESTFYGVDIDELFIQSAREKIKKQNCKNSYVFEVGDALNLPFEDNYFDLVISYTALTNIPNGKKVINEMRRVVKKDGMVASVTAQSFKFLPFYEGDYSFLQYPFYYEYKELRNKVEKMYQSIQPIGEYTQYGVAPEKIPSLYATSGLKNVVMHPIGYAFSLSNSIFTREEKIDLIKLELDAELEKFNAYLKIDNENRIITCEEEKKYVRLLNERAKTLIERVDDNNSWEWIGGAQLLMCGKK